MVNIPKVEYWILNYLNPSLKLKDLKSFKVVQFCTQVTFKLLNVNVEPELF